MNRKDWQIEIRDGFFRLESFLKNEVKRYDEFRQNHARLIELKRSGEYTQEAMEKKFSELARDFKAKSEEAHLNLLPIIDLVTQRMQKRYDEPLDLSDPTVPAAMTIIQAAGNRLPTSEIKKLVDGFTGDKAALKTLKAAFESFGIADGVREVNDRLYNPGDFKWQARDSSSNTIQQGTGINHFSSVVNRFAQKEGMTFPLDNAVSLDQQAIMEAARRGAGLSTPFDILR